MIRHTTGPILLVERVEDLPQPHVSSTRKECSACGDPVWIDVKTAVDFAPRCRIVCRRCLEEELLGERELTETEVEQFFGPRR